MELTFLLISHIDPKQSRFIGSIIEPIEEQEMKMKQDSIQINMGSQ